MSKKQSTTTMLHYAMNFGAVAGVYYIGKFCLFPLSLHSTMAALLFLGMTLVVPFLIYQLVKRYRDQYCDGHFEFTHALAFSMLTMAFGSLLAAATHYIYFAYIDGGAMIGTLVQNMEQLQSIDFSALEGVNADAIAQFDQYMETMQQTVEQLQAMSPIDITMGMLSNNISWSVIFSLPIAIIARRNKK